MSTITNNEATLEKANPEEPANASDMPEKLEEINKELIALHEEKLNLTNIEAELWLKISEEMEQRRRQKENLEKEVEQLRKRCEQLSKILNALIMESQAHS